MEKAAADGDGSFGRAAGRFWGAVNNKIELLLGDWAGFDSVELQENYLVVLFLEAGDSDSLAKAKAKSLASSINRLLGIGTCVPFPDPERFCTTAGVCPHVALCGSFRDCAPWCPVVPVCVVADKPGECPPFCSTERWRVSGCSRAQCSPSMLAQAGPSQKQSLPWSALLSPPPPFPLYLACVLHSSVNALVAMATATAGEC